MCSMLHICRSDLFLKKLINSALKFNVAPVAPKCSIPILKKQSIKFKQILLKNRIFFTLTFQMSGLVALRCSSINFHSSNLLRCLWQLHSLVLAGR